jgi:hypothetical protein
MLGFESYGIEPHSLKIGNDYVDDVLMVRHQVLHHVTGDLARKAVPHHV